MTEIPPSKAMANAQPQALAPPSSGPFDALKNIMPDMRSAALSDKRTVTEMIDAAKKSAAASIQVAASMMYQLSKGGSPITGPTIRCAEILDSVFGHSITVTRVSCDGSNPNDKFVSVQAFGFDARSNRIVADEFKRSIWGKHGQFSQDMIQTTIAACRAIAKRNVKFELVGGKQIAMEIMTHARAVMQVSKEDLAKHVRVNSEKIGLHMDEERLCAKYNKLSVDDLSQNQKIELISRINAVFENAHELDEEFPEISREPASEPKKKTEPPKTAQKAQKKEDKPASNKPQAEQQKNPKSGDLAKEQAPKKEEPKPKPAATPEESEKAERTRASGLIMDFFEAADGSADASNRMEHLFTATKSDPHTAEGVPAAALMRFNAALDLLIKSIAAGDFTTFDEKTKFKASDA